MTALSLAGVAAALLITWANLRPWWKGGRDPKALLPYGSALLLGLLATMCLGGILGWGADGIAALVTGGSDTAVSAVAGTPGAQVATARLGTLTPAGGVAVTAYFGCMLLAAKAAGKQDRRRMAGGLITGSVLGLLPGIVLLLDWLPTTVNDVGAYAQAALEGQVAL
ncbi:hypothetical protein [Streptomyces sp. NPDC090026]|uniref:hypothetical protein n=1 Tax=Streptomyces sp. NPDC090026 TaxID=3365923 RepID=UPI00380CD290